MPREAEWESRWWSPIINAEHLAMRDRVGMVDLSAFAIFDITGPGALDHVQRMAVAQMDVPVGRVVYTPLLNEAGGIKSDLTIMRLGRDAFRVVTGGAHGMGDRKWFSDHLPADGSAQLYDATSTWCTAGIWGPRARDVLASATSDDVSNEGFPFGTLPHDRARRHPGPRLADLVRRRARLGAVRPDGAGRPAVGHALGGGPAARHRPVRDRRLRHDRPAREGLSRPRRRARARIRPGRGRTCSDRRSRRPTSSAARRISSSARRPPVATLCTLTVDDNTSSSGVKRYMLGREPILTPDGGPITDAKGRRSFVTSAGSGPSVGQAPAAVVPAARVRGGRHEAPRRVLRRALPGHGRGRRLDAAVRPGQRAGPGLT